MPENEEYQDERLSKSETRELPMPNAKGPFSGRSVTGEYWGQDVQKVGKEGPEKVAIYGSDPALEWFKTDFRIAYKHAHDKIVAVTGREGYGKSTLALWLARAVEPELSVDDIIFSREKLQSRLKNADSGETIVVDEAGISMFAQEWWDKMQREVVKRLVAGRVKGLRIFFVSPHKNMLNNQIRNRRLDQWIYTLPVGRYGRGEAQVKEPKESKYELSVYWKPVMTFKFPKLEGEFWDRYTEKKEKFVDAVWTGEKKDGIDTHKIERFKLIHKMSEEGMTSTKIANYLTIGDSRVRNIRQELRDDDKIREKIEEA